MVDAAYPEVPNFTTVHPRAYLHDPAHCADCADLLTPRDAVTGLPVNAELDGSVVELAAPRTVVVEQAPDVTALRAVIAELDGR